MFNFHFYFLVVYTTLIISSAFGIYMEKSKVKDIEVEDIKGNDCPDYSPGLDGMEHCRFIFFCRGEECFSVNNTETKTIQFVNEEKKVQTLINEYCTPGDIKFANCTTAKCSTDSDCFTNKCMNGICTENKALEIEICMDAYKYGTLGNQNTVMHCGKNNNDECEEDKECASNECNHGICERNYHSSSDADIKMTIIVMIILFVFVIIIILMISGKCSGGSSSGGYGGGYVFSDSYDDCWDSD